MKTQCKHKSCACSLNHIASHNVNLKRPLHISLVMQSLSAGRPVSLECLSVPSGEQGFQDLTVICVYLVSVPVYTLVERQVQSTLFEVSFSAPWSWLCGSPGLGTRAWREKSPFCTCLLLSTVAGSCSVPCHHQFSSCKQKNAALLQYNISKSTYAVCLKLT